MGNNARPYNMIDNKKDHKGKTELKYRKDNAITTGSGVRMTCPAYIKDNTIAYKKWRDTLKVFEGTNLVSAGDITILEIYSSTYAQYRELYELRYNKVNSRAVNSSLETKIDSKINLLMKIQDRTFLNPLSKVKNIPKKATEKVDPLEDKFGDI